MDPWHCGSNVISLTSAHHRVQVIWMKFINNSISNLSDRFPMQIPLIKYQENSNMSNYVDCLAGCGCISLINKPTRFRKNSKPSLLDYIYTNICDEKRIINSGITIFDISDHLPIFVNFNLHHPTHQNSKPKFRCMKYFDPTIFVSDLSLKLNNLNPEAMM